MESLYHFIPIHPLRCVRQFWHVRRHLRADQDPHLMDHVHSVPPLNGLLIQLVHLLGRQGHTVLPPLHTCPTAYHCVIYTKDTAPASHPHVFGALCDMCKADGDAHGLPRGTAPVVQPHFLLRVGRR